MTGIAPSTSFAAPRGGSQTAVSSAPAAAVSGRDPRLDFYRGLAMFIILVAHIPVNAWAGWIPARFGFSDATEIFVFCSGMASAIAFGGACAGLGGAYLSLVRVPQWTDGMTAGAGWIALAIVVFASWKPWRALLGAYLFGGVTVLQLNLQAAGAAVPVALLSASPYLVTILVLVIISARGAHAAPASLGRPFHASS